MKKCPYCAEDIQSAAVVCRYCGRDIGPASRPNTVAHGPEVAAPGRATRPNPNDFQAWLDEGQALVESGRYQEALEALDRAKRIHHPDNAAARMAKYIVLLEMEREREAIRELVAIPQLSLDQAASVVDQAVRVTRKLIGQEESEDTEWLIDLLQQSPEARQKFERTFASVTSAANRVTSAANFGCFVVKAAALFAVGFGLVALILYLVNQ